MNVPDALVYTVVGLVLSQFATFGAYAFKKILEFERLREKVDALAAKIERKKK